MKKLLFCLIALSTLLLVACGDREEIRQHRLERNKPKVVVMDEKVFVQRRPFPDIHILADGGLRIDDIRIPTTPEQQAQLMQTFGMLQVVRQNTLASDTSGERTPKIIAPDGFEPFPPALLEAVPELREYTECFANLKAGR